MEMRKSYEIYLTKKDVQEAISQYLRKYTGLLPNEIKISQNAEVYPVYAKVISMDGMATDKEMEQQYDELR